MRADRKWINLGWRHPLWNMIRLYTPLSGKNIIKKWETDLQKQKIIMLGLNQVLNISAENVNIFFEYMEERAQLFNYAFDNLRLEDEALDFCNKNGFKVEQTTTKNRDHHQSSKSMVAAVSAIAAKVCKSKGIKVNSNPQGRCASQYPSRRILLAVPASPYPPRPYPPQPHPPRCILLGSTLNISTPSCRLRRARAPRWRRPSRGGCRRGWRAASRVPSRVGRSGRRRGRGGSGWIPGTAAGP